MLNPVVHKVTTEFLKGYEQGYYKSKVKSTQNFEWALNERNSKKNYERTRK